MLDCAYLLVEVDSRADEATAYVAVQEISDRLGVPCKGQLRDGVQIIVRPAKNKHQHIPLTVSYPTTVTPPNT